MRFRLAAAWIFAALLLSSPSLAEEAADSESTPADDGMFNLRLKTLGGKQFWTDVRFFHGWHIQRNAVTGHHRLLDATDNRLAWGSLEECQRALADIQQQQPAMKGKAVILLHGLFRTKGAMKKLESHLQEQGGYSVFRMGYPSTRDDLDAHAEALKSVIGQLDGIEQIDLVAHSLGNLVIRRYLAMTTDPATGEQGDPRIARIVMLAPPNHGSSFGEKVLPLDVTKIVTGDSAQAIANNWEELEAKLVTPQAEFGIIAGGKGDGDGFNPLIPGDDDMIVEVATTRLAGARDFRVVEAVHTFIMDHPEVQRKTLNFLRTGAFDPDGQRQPISAEREADRDG